MNFGSDLDTDGYGYAGHGYDGGGTDDGMSGFGGMGDASGWTNGDKLTYQPSLAPAGHGVGYWPGDTTADAVALDFMGYPSATAGNYRSAGSQAGDMASAAGAWDPQFRGAVMAFQQATGGGADGWIGPDTRQLLASSVASKNDAGGWQGGGGESPAAPAPDVGPSAPSSNTTTLLGLGAAAVAAFGAWWYLRR